MKMRNEIALKDRWNVEALYPNYEAWEDAYQKIARDGQQPRWPEIASLKGSLADGPEKVKEILDLILGLDRVLTKLYTYAHLRHDEDITEDRYKGAFARISTLIHEFNQEASWFDPELFLLPEATIEQYLTSPVLANYHFHLERIIRLKPHTLSEESERVLALAGQAVQSSYKTFCAMSDADLKFGTVKDQHGKDRELTHGQYGLYIRDQDRTLRANAFKQYHQQYANYENTLCEMLIGQVQRNLFYTQSRHYPSCLDAALYPNDIDTSVYHALIEATNKNISSLHNYVSLRQDILKLDEIHLYDMYVPLTSQIDIHLSYEEAEQLIIDSVAPLGSEYQNFLKKGLQEQRWVDRYENHHKRSGAYSSGCYDSMPYILMNYKGILRDVFTLAHEAGHSMHSLLSRKSQPYHYSNYPIFVAEVASTFNEELLMQQLLRHFTGKAEQIYLINQKIEDIRTTLFRQTMFAEFELIIHEMTEQNIPLTPRVLKERYRELNAKYFGKNAVIDPEIDIEWARIPHFYYQFYVYQYATGISAALALADRVLQGGKTERDAYLSFLKGGGSRHPIDLLRLAGVDMKSPQPVSAAIGKFDHLITQLRRLQGMASGKEDQKPQTVSST